ncbi:MAG: hypothetical protein WCY41_05485 [Candidatus Micrarchaeia archaeon]
MKAQGATEYLVLLAVVLIVALVSVALLGFFPGMASDAQITQSQIYWQSASPIAITEWSAHTNSASYSLPYLRIKNNGIYPIRITKFLGPNGNWTGSLEISVIGRKNISDYFYLAPGEDSYIAWNLSPLTTQLVYFYSGGSTGSNSWLGGASSLCNYNDTANPGTLVMPDFGFEYIQYMDSNQQITKREIGKDLIVRCS